MGTTENDLGFVLDSRLPVTSFSVDRHNLLVLFSVCIRNLTTHPTSTGPGTIVSPWTTVAPPPLSPGSISPPTGHCAHGHHKDPDPFPGSCPSSAQNPQWLQPHLRQTQVLTVAHKALRLVQTLSDCIPASLLTAHSAQGHGLLCGPPPPLRSCPHWGTLPRRPHGPHPSSALTAQNGLS